MNTDTRFSKQSFNEFIEFVSKKGLIPKNTASGWKSSAKQLFSILDEDEVSDLRTIDVDELVKRYANLKGAEVQGSSLKTYRSKLSTALSHFNQWASNPMQYSPATPRKGARKSKTHDKKEERDSIDTDDSKTYSIPISNSGKESLIFPIPISNGRIVTINNLPYELSKGDAERICAVVRALTTEG